MKLLIIDDNKSVRLSLKMVLSDEFEQIVTVDDPRLVPALLKQGRFDVVLLDMNFDDGRLDGSDGLFWLRRIKEEDMAPAVVLITAFGNVALAVEAMKYGAEDFVTKPWDNDILKAKLRSAVEKCSRDRMAARTLDKARAIERKERDKEEMTLEEVKLAHVTETVARCGGNLTAAAARLGINRQTLYNLLRKK